MREAILSNRVERSKGRAHVTKRRARLSYSPVLKQRAVEAYTDGLQEGGWAAVWDACPELSPGSKAETLVRGWVDHPQRINTPEHHRAPGAGRKPALPALDELAIVAAVREFREQGAAVTVQDVQHLATAFALRLGLHFRPSEQWVWDVLHRHGMRTLVGTIRLSHTFWEGHATDAAAAGSDADRILDYLAHVRASRMLMEELGYGERHRTILEDEWRVGGTKRPVYIVDDDEAVRAYFRDPGGVDSKYEGMGSSIVALCAISLPDASGLPRLLPPMLIIKESATVRRLLEIPKASDVGAGASTPPVIVVFTESGALRDKQYAGNFRTEDLNPYRDREFGTRGPLHLVHDVGGPHCTEFTEAALSLDNILTSIVPARLTGDAQFFDVYQSAALRTQYRAARKNIVRSRHVDDFGKSMDAARKLSVAILAFARAWWSQSEEQLRVRAAQMFRLGLANATDGSEDNRIRIKLKNQLLNTSSLQSRARKWLAQLQSEQKRAKEQWISASAAASSVGSSVLHPPDPPAQRIFARRVTGKRKVQALADVSTSALSSSSSSVSSSRASSSCSSSSSNAAMPEDVDADDNEDIRGATSPEVGDFVVLKGSTAREPFLVAQVQSVEADGTMTVRWWGTTSKTPLTARWYPGWDDPTDKKNNIGYQQQPGSKEWKPFMDSHIELAMVVDWGFDFVDGKLPDKVQRLIREQCQVRTRKR